MKVFLFAVFSAIYFNAQIKPVLGDQVKNVCQYEEECNNNIYTLKERVFRSCLRQRRKSKNFDFEKLKCNADRSVIVAAKNCQWRFECCPGWKANKQRFYTQGCRKFVSCVTLPQFTPQLCSRRRKAELKKNRQIYRFTTPSENIPDYPVTDSNVMDFLTFPTLNMTSKQVINFTLSRPEERQCAVLFLGMNKKNRITLHEMLKPGRFSATFKKYSDYANLLDIFRGKQHTGGPADKYFRFPSQEGNFKDIIKSNAWQQDDVFVEQRLAGINPMSIRKLQLKEHRDKHSGFSPELDNAISKAVGQKTNMAEMVKEGLVYILDYPLIRNLTNVADATERNTTDRREMRSSQSPIAIFVTVKNFRTKKYKLEPVAIQTYFDKSSPVLTPADGSKWLLAKEEVQRADFLHTEIIEHLLKAHIMMGTVCIALFRTFPPHHPLHEMLRWHCRGNLMLNILAVDAFLVPGGVLHLLLAPGHIGVLELLNKGYKELSWHETDFEKRLKERGVDDRKKLPYFPYRDDGLILWRLIKRFAKEYVNLYYKNRRFVEDDKELQNFANELSPEGKGQYGGIGMIKDFPAKILTKEQLVDVLTQILFLPIQHHAVNYPVAYYGAFVPNMPSKLYDDPQVSPGEFNIYRLPRTHVALRQIVFSMNLGLLRCDKLFDYGSKLTDSAAGNIVTKYYRQLQQRIRVTLIERNKKRFEQGQMAYPYFLPDLLPNSIHV